MPYIEHYTIILIIACMLFAQHNFEERNDFWAWLWIILIPVLVVLAYHFSQWYETVGIT